MQSRCPCGPPGQKRGHAGGAAGLPGAAGARSPASTRLEAGGLRGYLNAKRFEGLIVLRFDGPIYAPPQIHLFSQVCGLKHIAYAARLRHKFREAHYMGPRALQLSLKMYVYWAIALSSIHGAENQ